MVTRPKVLSIDDNSTNQKLVEKVLSDSYEVKTVLSGTSGIEELYNFKPDAILLDVDMPNLDGFRLCRMIRSEPAFAETPILFVSGLNGQEDHLRGFQVGGDDYIDKPIDIHMLKQKLSFNLGRAQQRLQHPPSQDALGLDQNIQYLHEYLLALMDLEQLERLGPLMLETLNKMGLKGAVYRHHDQHTDSSIGPLTDLESILLEQATQTYPMDHSARFLWGSKHLGAIIQNMPNPNESQHQPLRQILVTFFKATDQKVHQLFKSPGLRAPKAESPPPKSARHSRELLHVHGYKLECALELLETQSEQNLSVIARHLQQLANDTSTDPEQRQTFKSLLDQCMATRMAIYDQCLEIQSQYHQIMQCNASATDLVE